MEALKSMREKQVRIIVQEMLQDERCEIEEMLRVQREATRADLERFFAASKADMELLEQRFEAHREAVHIPPAAPAERSGELDAGMRQLGDRVDALHAFVAGMRSDGEVMHDSIETMGTRVAGLEDHAEAAAGDASHMRDRLEALRREFENLSACSPPDPLPAVGPPPSLGSEAGRSYETANPCEAAVPRATSDSAVSGEAGGGHIADFRRRLEEDRPGPGWSETGSNHGKTMPQCDPGDARPWMGSSWRNILTPREAQKW